jgi:hypothetical protein
MSQQSTPIFTLTQLLSGTVTARRFVKVTGAQAGAGENTLGVARTGGSSGERIAVDVLGTAVVEAGAAVTAGDTIKADSNGKAITWATSGAKVALALQTAAGDGSLIEVLLIPNVA